ncbi:acyltransferase [Hahella sp. CR1]|uniref:acyltransferase family protein n=1 Tax=Hahella sp. CR1 TaxID=2992807 RepID=UPI00244239ED|nr:acyltransferase [Hahella sp. CR1]MDG9671477.1 acyltransferase [Hahella sp. CR1]
MKLMEGSRFKALDAIRGIAALAVVFFHLYVNLWRELDWLPEPIRLMLNYGYLGVSTFFVLSGFVIAHSTRCEGADFRYMGRFALRRAIRLDPPYWASIVITIVLALLVQRVFQVAQIYPSAESVIAHIFYLQYFLGYPPVISEVYWTLCIEVQLYLFLVLVYVLLNKLKAWRNFDIMRWSLLFMFAIGVISALQTHKAAPELIKGLFLPYWHYFFLGVSAYYALSGVTWMKYLFFAFVGIEVALQAGASLNGYVIVGVASVAVIYGLGLLGWLTTGLAQWPLQYLGKISYSLYLVHSDIGWKAISFGKRLLEDQVITPLLSTLLFLLGLIASLVAAQLLYWIVERPSIKAASKLNKHSAEPYPQDRNIITS